MKLTPKRRAMLERIAKANGTLLEINVTASGGSSASILNSLRRDGLVRRSDHPTVKHGGFPADALSATEAGRAALATKETAP